MPYASITKSDLAPLLSAQLRTAPVGRPMVIRNLLPEEPAPVQVAVGDIRVQGEQDCSEMTRIDGERTSIDQQTSPVSISSGTISLTSSDVPRFDILLEDLL